MTLTLLLDLDDTLLGNDMGAFLPAYFQALTGHLSDYGDGQEMVGQLVSSTQKMMSNQLPDRTLKQVFDDQFYRRLGWTYEDMEAPIADFYARVFPELKTVTQPRPEAGRLVEEALGRGYRIAIATNPLFPRAAILERLKWAGVPADRYDFDLITSYEEFHFAKPNPAYYAEILARLGWPEEPAVMIGDDPENDIAAARCLGLPTFWVNGDQPPPGPFDSLPSGSGGLRDFLSWLDAHPSETLQPRYNHPLAIQAILRATPAAISALTKDLPSETWSRRPAEDEWSLTEIVCHLRDSEAEVYLPRIREIQAKEEPLIQGVDTDVWAEERDYFSQDGQEALADFTATRIETLETLAQLGAEDWQRPARHTIFGPTHLQELVNFNARHDRLHLRQLKTTFTRVS